MNRSPRVGDENRALAAHGLGDEHERRLGRVERRGVELHELHVAQLHAGAMRERNAVSGRDRGVGGVAIDLPAAAGGEHGGVRDDLERCARLAHARARAAAVVHDEVERARALEDRDVRRSRAHAR